MSRIFWVPVAAAGTDVQVAAGSLAISGYAPTISQPVALVPGYGSLTLTGFAPSVTQSAGTNVLPAVGSLAIAGYAPSVAQPNNVTAGVGSVTITGYAPVVVQPQTAVPSVGNLAITGYAPSVSQSSASPNLIPGFGALSITGYAPTIEQSLPATAGGGRFKRKRVFIDGKAYFLNPQEVANLLVERAAKAAEETEATADELHADVLPACIQAIDYEAIKASGVKASQAFIDRMNAEIERMKALEIQRQLDEEDDIECLMLLL